MLSSYSVEELENLKNTIDMLQNLKKDVAGPLTGPSISHGAGTTVDNTAPSISGVSNDICHMDIDKSLVSACSSNTILWLSLLN